MKYSYKGKTPLEVAEKFIDSYIERIPVEKFLPGDVPNYHQGVFLSGVEKYTFRTVKQNTENILKTFLKEF